jgi:hypothetical protein
VYTALLNREHDRNARDEQRPARMQRELGYHYRRCNRRLAEVLEAGKPVVMNRGAVESALSSQEGALRLPLDRSVRVVRVSADDRVIPAMEPEGRNL